jgi:prepilin peptidase CpaA
MPLDDVARFAIATGVTGVLIWAAVSDIRTRTIPNLSVLAVIGFFLPWVAVSRGAGLASALEAAGVALVVTVALCSFRLFGAGDAKLFSAVALFAGLDLLPILAIATALAGGAMAAVTLASRPTRALAILTLGGKGDSGRGIPYGVAIALGSALTLWIRTSALISLPWSSAVRQGLARVLG